MLDKPETPPGAITLSTRLAIYDFLKPILTKHDNGFWSYAEGWNDALVAKAFNDPSRNLNASGNEVTKSAVSYVRKEGFGSLKAPTITKDRPAEDSALEARVDGVTERLNGLMERIERRLVRFEDTIIDGNRRYNNVRHDIHTLQTRVEAIENVLRMLPPPAPQKDPAP